ncbi:uncharacterized protein LOC143037193 [Oratosquilla oratoria]|uniref:uncharacterized protein LOC143037193 n=1 Tax=Oratosquilla oratoria TaxID=337810 RepID=UPI003F76AD43
MNTFFNHRPENKWTWYRWNAEREEYSKNSMIGLVLTRSKTVQNRDRDNVWRNIGEDLQNDVEGTRKLLFSMAKSRKDGNEKQFSVKNTTGELLTEPERKDERWEEYFRNLLKAPENGGTAKKEEEEVEFDEQLTGDMVDRITVSNVKDSLLKMRNNKATGYNGKKYERILEKKLRSIVEDVLHETHNGFRPGRGTTDLVFALKIIMEKSSEWDIKKHVALLYIEKAFDRVPRQMLWRAMKKAEYQIPLKVERAIKSLCVSNKTLVRPVAKVEKWFDVTSGVRQGSVILSLLFILLMDQVVKVVGQRSGESGNYAILSMLTTWDWWKKICSSLQT